MSDKTAISTDAAPRPAHAFPQGVRKGPIVQVSGQGPVDPDTGNLVGEGDVATQTIRVLRNVEAILAAGGTTFEDVTMLRVYLTTQDDFAAMNEAYGAFVSQRIGDGVAPCRTTVFAGLPREGMLVEIDAQAVVL